MSQWLLTWLQQAHRQSRHCQGFGGWEKTTVVCDLVRVRGNPTRLIVLNERKFCCTGDIAAPVGENKEKDGEQVDQVQQDTTMDLPRRRRNRAKSSSEDLYLFQPPKTSFFKSTMLVHPLSARAMLCLRVGRLSPRFRWIYSTAACLRAHGRSQGNCEHRQHGLDNPRRPEIPLALLAKNA